MTGVTRTVGLTVFLLVFSDFLHGESSPQSPEIPDETETGILNESFSAELTHGKNNHTEDSRFIKCLICKQVVKSIIKRFRRRLQEKTAKVCWSFIPKLRATCFSQGGKLKEKLINAIFPDGQWGTCNRMEIC